MEPLIDKHVTKQMMKVKHKKETVELEYIETTHIIKKDPETKEVISEDKFPMYHFVESKFVPHQDFLDAMKMLRKPVIDICEFGNFKNFDQYTIKGISLSGMDSDDTARVVITASKKLEHNNKPFNFNTPATTLFDESEYGDAAKLDEFVNKIVQEAWEYLGGKHAVSPQLKLEFEGGEEMEMAVQK